MRIFSFTNGNGRFSPKSWLLYSALWFCAALVLSGFSQVQASGGDDFTDKLKVAFSYKIIQFVEWSERSTENPHRSINICVMASQRLDRLFGDFEAKPVNGQTVQTVYLKQPPDPSDSCSLLYVDSSQNARLPEILAHVSSQGQILTVSDIENFSRKGGMVEFRSQDKSVKIELNISNITSAGIRISSKLMEVASIVQ